jgi:uncharacterized SAM-binding protein YcdF (DUF218 family)
VKFTRRIIFYLCVIAFTCALIIAGNYLTLPTHNTEASHFDTLIILGTPADSNGMPSPEQRERVLEGVREYKAGVAPHVIMTGGAVYNSFVEAHTMAQFAASQGIPSSAIVEEPQARNTIQNIFYSSELMHRNHWSSAEIISSPSHLGRTSLILNTFNLTQPSLSIDWRIHAAHWPPEYSLQRELTYYSVEAMRCLQLRFLGFPSSKFLPKTSAVP